MFKIEFYAQLFILKALFCVKYNFKNVNLYNYLANNLLHHFCKLLIC